MQEQHEEKSGDVQYIRKANHVLLVDPNRFDTDALDTVAMNENENELGGATCAIQNKQSHLGTTDKCPPEEHSKLGDM